MSRAVLCFALALAITIFTAFAFTSVSYAEEIHLPLSAGSPLDVVNAVNALRASYGLAPYSISSILMATAQNHADYMAATGHSSHTGAGGSSVTERLLAAGYPLAGDLSLGGFRSENITSGNEDMSAEMAVTRWTGDSIHLNTMISPNLTEIGAGVTVNDGRVYYVIDCALPTTNGIPQPAGTSIPGVPTAIPAGGVIIPVVVATPNADGNLIHEVKAGQTLWQIAISYNTKIDEIKRLNNLLDNEIYPGSRLVIKTGVFLTPDLSTVTMTAVQTSMPTSSPATTATLLNPTSTLTPLNQRVPTSNNSVRAIVMGIIAVALVGGIIVAWLGVGKK